MYVVYDAIIIKKAALIQSLQIEVREAAATTLSGIVRCSQRDSVLAFKVSSQVLSRL